MFIKVRYGHDELLLCNPQCVVNNLLDNIRLRCGLANSGKILDLSDESGLVLRLNEHKEDYSDLYLSDHSTYILVEKQTRLTKETALLSNYVPLLDNVSALLPKFKLRVSVDTPFVNLHQKSHNTSRAERSTSSNKSPNRKTKRVKTKTPKDSR